MKKLSIGLIIFGVIFILVGLKSLIGVSTSVYFAHKAMAPDIHKTVVAKVFETEKLIEKQKDKNKDIKIAQAQIQLQRIKNEMSEYKEKYVKGNLIPAPLMIFIIFSIFTAIIFIYTGISILQLKTSTRKWISLSFLAGLLCTFVFFWSTASTMFFINNLTGRFLSIFAMIDGNIYHKTGGISLVIDIFFSTPIAIRMTFIFYALYLAFMSITSIFFARPKIKELFKQA